jgi:Asp/Glu/hydantoin racemase
MAIDTLHHDLGRGALNLVADGLASAQRGSALVRGQLSRIWQVSASFTAACRAALTTTFAVRPTTAQPVVAVKAATVLVAKRAGERIGAAEQFARVAGVVSSAIETVTDVNRRQAAVAQQLDLAQYALNSLSDELSAVMSVPGWRERAPVYRFEPVPVRAQSALAA